MKDVIGVKFGRLTVESVYMKQGKTQRHTYAKCVCDCGQKCDVVLNNIKQGNTKSCGCLYNEKSSNYKHGKSKHQLIFMLSNIKERCKNPKNKSYRNYGKRGISVCDEWQNPINFYNWAIKNGWKKELQIDRIDNDDNYCPENCRFVTCKTNNRNRRDNVYITVFGETKLLIEWAEDERCVVTCSILRGRMRRGWKHESAILKPARKCH